MLGAHDMIHTQHIYIYHIVTFVPTATSVVIPVSLTWWVCLVILVGIVVGIDLAYLTCCDDISYYFFDIVIYLLVSIRVQQSIFEW